MTKRIELPEPVNGISAEYLAVLLDVSLLTIRRYLAAEILPEPIERHPRLLWDPDTIQAWVKTRVPGKWRYAKEESSK